MSKENYLKSVEGMGQRLPNVLDNQINDVNLENYGGFIKPGVGIATANPISSLLSVYFCPDSKYYRNEILRERLLNASKFLVKIQHKDGTIDLCETNYYSPPDTAFAVWSYTPWLEFLRKIHLKGQEKEILENLEYFLKRASIALQSGGFHTANHRWVNASALAKLGNLFNNEKCKKAAEEYLEEGIDCNEDGLFSEKSIGVYNPICASAMLILAEELKKPELMNYVIKALEFALYFLEKDGTILNTFSLRQDRELRRPAFGYYHLFKRMSVLKNEGRYAQAADCIFENGSKKYKFSPLSLFLFYPELKEEKTKRQALPRIHSKYFKKSGILRINNVPSSLTFTQGSDEFLVIVLDDIDIRFRYLTSFFGKGAFVGKKMENNKDSYTLQQKIRWGYRELLPKEERNKNIPWFDTIPLRKWIKIEEIETLITLVPKNEFNGGKLHITTQGCKNVLTMLEIVLPKEGEFSFDGKVTRLKDEVYLLKEGKFRYAKESIFFKIGPGSAGHAMVNFRGDKTIKKDKILVVMTFCAPFEHILDFSYGDTAQILSKKYADNNQF